MNCQESRRLLQAYADQQLPAHDAQAVGEHLAGCPACRAELAQLNSLRGMLKTHGMQHAAPEHLRRRIRLAIRGQAGPASAPEPAPARHAGWWQRLADLPWAWINFGVACACSLALAFVLVSPPSADFGEDQLAQELTASHFRSLLADHLADVASSDQHTVKPWFAGKLDFSPPVYDFAQGGYPLAGGRLDYVDQRIVAALVYRHKRHVLNLFIWPAKTGARTEMQHLTRQGYQLVHWTQAGMQYWLISDMNQTDLGGFESLLTAQLEKDTGASH